MAAPDTGKVLRMGEVAARLGLSYGRFQRAWRGWVAERGFPAALPGLRWDAAVLERWIVEQSAAKPAPPTPRAPARDPRDAAWDQLEHLRGR